MSSSYYDHGLNPSGHAPFFDYFIGCVRGYDRTDDARWIHGKEDDAQRNSHLKGVATLFTSTFYGFLQPLEVYFIYSRLTLVI
jgi:hypothetical protein